MFSIKEIRNGKKMMKILIIAPYLPLSGGVSNYIKLLLIRLDCKKFHIELLSVGKTGFILLDSFYPLLILIQLLKLKKILKNYKPDIVHLNPSLTYAAILRDFIFLKTIKRCNIPVIFFIHGWHEAISNNFKKIFFKNFFKRKFELADAIVVLANKFKNKLVDLGVNATKIYVSYTMVESEKYSIDNKFFSNPYLVLFCSNIKKEKGIFELLDAIPLVIKKYSDTKFIFIGGGKDLIKLKKKSKLLQIEKNVIFTGYISTEEKINIFKKSHIFAFPSFHGEGFPTVIIEAMAAGLPIITTPVAGLADAIDDNKEGLILSIKPSGFEIAKKIIQLLENQNLMEKMSKNNIMEAKEKYDHKKISNSIIKLYENLLIRKV